MKIAIAIIKGVFILMALFAAFKVADLLLESKLNAQIEHKLNLEIRTKVIQVLEHAEQATKNAEQATKNAEQAVKNAEQAVKNAEQAVKKSKP